jgi:hypothetical protein
MFTKLPAEIIVTISSYLPTQDKINLITTCHTLNSLISKVNLHSELDLYTAYKTKAIIKRFQDKQYNGAQVKNLRIHLSELEPDLFNQLHTIFPNITSIYPYRVHRSVVKDKATTPMSRWINTIEQYNTSHGWCDIWYWLERDTFPHLTKLEIEEGFRLQKSEENLNRMHFHPFIKTPLHFER